MTSAAPPTRTDPSWSRARREALAVSAVMAAYFGLRLVVEGRHGRAVGNAERLLGLERRFGLDVELHVQSWVLDHPPIRIALSAAYVWLHWPLLIAVMAFLTWRAPAVQARLRRALAMSAAAGLVLFATVPMAPPRFLPGYVGTVSDAARRHYLPYSLDWTNRFAAFPSYHVGWTLIACIAVAGVVERRSVRGLLLAPAAVVAIAVVGTGNHYVLDSLAGAALAIGGWVVAGWLAGRVPAAADVPATTPIPAPTGPRPRSAAGRPRPEPGRPDPIAAWFARPVPAIDSGAVESAATGSGSDEPVRTGGRVRASPIGRSSRPSPDRPARFRRGR